MLVRVPTSCRTQDDLPKLSEHPGYGVAAHYPRKFRPERRPAADLPSDDVKAVSRENCREREASLGFAPPACSELDKCQRVVRIHRNYELVLDRVVAHRGGARDSRRDDLNVLARHKL